MTAVSCGYGYGFAIYLAASLHSKWPSLEQPFEYRTYER